MKQQYSSSVEQMTIFSFSHPILLWGVYTR
uniref:Uncharacterized protein n=1 Tax=Rhizophora mucronata TaxID=61149 RepID=A0A2P2PRQ7_RHIMU